MRNWGYCLVFQNRSFSWDTESSPQLFFPGSARSHQDTQWPLWPVIKTHPVLLPSIVIVGWKVCGAACKHNCSLCQHFSGEKCMVYTENWIFFYKDNWKVAWEETIWNTVFWIVIFSRKNKQLEIICQLSFTLPLLQWMPLWLQFHKALSHHHIFPAASLLGRSTGPCQPPTNPSVPSDFIVEGKVGYRKVICCSSAQGVSSSEIYKLALADRHQCRASMRHSMSDRTTGEWSKTGWGISHSHLSRSICHSVYVENRDKQMNNFPEMAQIWGRKMFLSKYHSK